MAVGQMRSLRIFYCEDDHSSGQLVIASRESQYKILHFHHGGLERLASVFEDWTFLAQPKHRVSSPVCESTIKVASSIKFYVLLIPDLFHKNLMSLVSTTTC